MFKHANKTTLKQPASRSKWWQRVLPFRQENSSVVGALANTPKHVAIIMDGNNRWAKRKAMRGLLGHKQGVESIRSVMKSCRKHNIQVLTLFAFSCENWQRPQGEVSALMNLFEYALDNEVEKLIKNNVRLKVIGRRDRFRPSIVAKIEAVEKKTHIEDAKHPFTLVIAADYSGQWDIAQACRRAVAERVDQIDESVLSEYMSLSELPAVDLCIRTGGEVRISNFLLWQVAYAELYFTDELWPDFSHTSLDQAVNDFQFRQRRFGLSQDQVQSVGNG